MGQGHPRREDQDRVGASRTDQPQGLQSDLPEIDAHAEICLDRLRTHAEFSRDFRQRALRILVPFYGCVRNHPEATGIGKMGDQLIGHAIAKVFLLWIRRKIAEWEHSQGLNAMSPRASKPSIAKMVPIKCKYESDGYAGRR